MNKEIKKFNAMLINVVKGTIHYMTSQDLPFRPKALRSQVWDLREKIQKVNEDLPESPLVQACTSFFLEECTKIEKENPDFDHMESDFHVDIFIELLEIWNDSIEVKDMVWDGEKNFIKVNIVQKIKETLTDLAEELEQKKATAQ